MAIKNQKIQVVVSNFEIGDILAITGLEGDPVLDPGSRPDETLPFSDYFWLWIQIGTNGSVLLADLPFPSQPDGAVFFNAESFRSVYGANAILLV